MSLSSNKPIANRSVPASTIIPVLAYENVGQAVDWLCSVFGFEERLRIGSHRAQLLFGDGAVIVIDGGEGLDATTARAMSSHSVHVRVADVDHHYEHAQAHGAVILQPLASFPFGERQYSVQDPGGHCWTFSESIADVDPEEWGATLPTQGSASLAGDALKE